MPGTNAMRTTCRTVIVETGQYTHAPTKHHILAMVTDVTVNNGKRTTYTKGKPSGTHSNSIQNRSIHRHK